MLQCKRVDESCIYLSVPTPAEHLEKCRLSSPKRRRHSACVNFPRNPITDLFIGIDGPLSQIPSGSLSSEANLAFKSEVSYTASEELLH